MNTETINALKEIGEKINEINTLKVELEHLIEDVENGDFEDSLREYVEAIDEAESYVFDTFRAYENELKAESLDWIY